MQTNWQMIRDRLTEDIMRGEYAPGERLPTEPELCRHFGIGRHSIRRAIDALVVEGKLRVEQGRGTFVEAAPLINYQIGRRTRFRQNLRDQGVAPGGDVIEVGQVSAPAAVACALELPEGAPVHRVLTRGLADDVPISIGLSWHPAERFADFGQRRSRGEKITDIYRAYGIADYLRRSTSVFARRARKDEALLLAQHPALPVMVMQKTDVDMEGRPIGHSQGIWSAERVQFTLDTDPLPTGGDQDHMS